MSANLQFRCPKTIPSFRESSCCDRKPMHDSKFAAPLPLGLIVASKTTPNCREKSRCNRVPRHDIHFTDIPPTELPLALEIAPHCRDKNRGDIDPVNES